MQSGELKNLIWDIITNTDDVDESGKVVPIKSFKKDHFKGQQQIKKAIRNQIGLQIEKITTNEDGTEDKKVLAIPSSEYQAKYSDCKILGEFHTSEDIVFTEKMKEALRFYWNEREGLPEFATEESVEELEDILG